MPNPPPHPPHPPAKPALTTAAATLAPHPQSPRSTPIRRLQRPAARRDGPHRRSNSAANSPSPPPPSPSPATADSSTTRPSAWPTAQHLTQAQQNSLFRIASVTKPITSVTIFSLIEQGKLNLTDKVFGPSAILGIKYGKPPYKQCVTDITVDHLLTHTCGGWPNDANDPMMHNLSWNHDQAHHPDHRQSPPHQPARHPLGLLQLRLLHPRPRHRSKSPASPTTPTSETNILAPCGISTMQIAGNKESQQRPGRGRLLRPVRRRPLQAQRHPHGLARRMDRLLHRARPVPQPRRRSPRHPRAPQARHHQNHDHPRPRLPTPATPATPAAGWSATTEPETGGTTAASPAPPPSWSAPPPACAGPPYATPAPNPPTRSTPPSIK